MPQTELNPQELPGIPPKRYFTIGEVAQLCEVKNPCTTLLGARVPANKAGKAQ